MTITQNELLDALAAAQSGMAAPVDGAMTVLQIVQCTGWSRGKVMKNIHAMHAQGGVQVVYIPTRKITGNSQMTPAYRFLTPKQKKGK